MKVAYWPGCVSRGFTPELHGSMEHIAPLLGIELVELDRASCCGAGVIAEHNQELADTLNARTFALAQQAGSELTMMNICSTCQGAQTECQERLDANASTARWSTRTSPSTASSTRRACRTRTCCGCSWRTTASTSCASGSSGRCRNLKVGPFYGCYIVRPTDRLGIDDDYPRDTYLGAPHRGARRHGHRVRRRAEVLRLPDHHDEQGGVAQAGGPPPRATPSTPTRTASSPPARCATSTSTCSSRWRSGSWGASSTCRSCTSRSSSGWRSG